MSISEEDLASMNVNASFGEDEVVIQDLRNRTRFLNVEVQKRDHMINLLKDQNEKLKAENAELKKEKPKPRTKKQT